jgi:thioredoxin-like negative regulator of GroEL
VNGTGVEVLVITAPWCAHCRAMAPALDRLEAIHGASMRFERIDAAAEPDRVDALGVRAIPTVIVRVEGTERARVVGRVADRDLERFIASTGGYRPLPFDGIMRAAAGLALLGIGWWLGVLALLVIGAALTAWSAVTMWRWTR